MIKLPINGKWSQPNNSDKFGALSATKNINLDEEGYLKLSPRTVALYRETDNPDFGVPAGIDRYGNGRFLVATDSDAAFDVSVDADELNFDENGDDTEPTLSAYSDALLWQAAWYATTSSKVVSRVIADGSNGDWTDRFNLTTSAVRHPMVVFQSRQTLCIGDKNVVRQISTGHSASNLAQLTLTSDYEVVGLAYNNERIGVLCRFGSATEGQAREVYFFTWDGKTAASNGGYGLGAHSGVAIVPFKSSFVVLTQTGEAKFFNGGGFGSPDGSNEPVALPFYYTDLVWGDLLNQIGKQRMAQADGETLLLNLPLQLERFGRKQETYRYPSGVWCLDPKVGLYHRFSPSISKAYRLQVLSVDAPTDIITVSGTIPASGNPIRYTSAGTAIGGLVVNRDYYIIKVSASTLKLAVSREAAKQGVAIDLTSSGAVSYFWAYDLVDFGNSHTNEAGALLVLGESNMVYKDVMFGGSYADTSLSNIDTICAPVPYLENRGWFTVSKVYADGAEDTAQQILLKYRPLAEGDAILVKVKTKDVIGLPVSTTGTSGAVWDTERTLFSTADLSEAKAYLDGATEAEPRELEMEIVSGAGGGTLVKVAGITENDGTYFITLAEDVIGATSGLKCHFVLDNFKVVETITEGDYAEVGIGETAKSVIFKVELRGYETTIEEVQIPMAKHK